MPLAKFPTQRLAAAYVDATQQALPRLTKEIARLIARAFQQQTRHIVDFTEQTDGDASGELIDTEMPFILENYLTVADFWEEYDGSREPSFESGQGWYYPTFDRRFQRELPTMLAPVYLQALKRLQRDEPTYYQQLASYIQQEENPDATTPEELFDVITFNEWVGDAETQCEMLVIEHVQPLLLASLLQKHQLPRRCQRAVLEKIAQLAPFMDEIASYCVTVAHATSMTKAGALQLHIERTDEGVIFGEYAGARELLMDRIAQEGSLILRCTAAQAGETGQPLEEVRAWFITADAKQVMPHRILPDDLYEAMNTDADTGAKLPPEPNTRYL